MEHEFQFEHFFQVNVLTFIRSLSFEYFPLKRHEKPLYLQMVNKHKLKSQFLHEHFTQVITFQRICNI